MKGLAAVLAFFALMLAVVLGLFAAALQLDTIEGPDTDTGVVSVPLLAAIPQPSGEYETIAAEFAAKLDTPQGRAVAHDLAGLYWGFARVANHPALETTRDVRDFQAEAGRLAFPEPGADSGIGEWVEGLFFDAISDEPRPLTGADRAKVQALVLALAHGAQRVGG